MVDVLDDKSFQKRVIDDGEVILVDFWASWCGPCKALAPVLEEVSHDEEFKGRLKFAKISTEDFPDPAQKNGVSGIPCLIIFKDGKEVDRIVGFSPKPVLTGKIKDILAKI
jgi:thioredoxin 1